MANMGYDETARGHSPAGAGGMSERVHSPWTGDIDYDAGPVSTTFQSCIYMVSGIVCQNQGDYLDRQSNQKFQGHKFRIFPFCGFCDLALDLCCNLAVFLFICFGYSSLFH